MNDKKLREDFNTLIEALKRSLIIKDECFLSSSDEINMLMGKYCPSAIERIEKLEKEISSQQKIISMLFEHLKIELYRPSSDVVIKAIK